MGSVYLETTIPSYLTAWRSPDLVMAARQQLTREWWDTRRNDFELVVSQLVLEEAAAGDADAAARRLESLDGIRIIVADETHREMARTFVRDVPLPPRAAADALHIALAVANGVDFILTWNFTHIANAEFRPKIEEVCRSMGFVAPVICTPEELLKKSP